MLVNKYIFKSLKVLDLEYDSLKSYEGALAPECENDLKSWWNDVEFDKIYMLSDPLLKTIEENGRKMLEASMEDIKPCKGFFLCREDFAIAYQIQHNEYGLNCILMCFDKGKVVLSGIVRFIDYKDGVVQYRCLCGNAPCGKEKVEEMMMIEARTAICIEAFLRYAKVEQVVIENGQRKSKDKKKPLPLQNFSGYPIKYIDSTWVREIIRVEGFKVRGHFRMQPKKKNGEWTKELIYINEFEKHGYHRKAGIIQNKTD